MSFVSLKFAAFFFPLAILSHLVPRFFLTEEKKVQVQKILLLAASLFFYALVDLRFVPCLLYVIIVSYFGGIFCRNKISLAAFVTASLAPLLFFKYSRVRWIFPLGISFFTFQSIGYIVDVYKKKIEVEKNPLDIALFVSFFPTISSGPIQRAGNLIPQFQKLHSFDYDNATDGMKLFAWGLFKKIVIADRIALYVNYVYGNIAEQYGLALLFATFLYSFQIYCDFSGYSDMAIGAAKYLGFDVGKNFDHPYLSQTVGEFWRRWHISLSSWLRDYVYIPLGGSRVALPRIYLNLLITFLVSGVWHGSTWNFVIWGALHGLYLCAERATKGLREKTKFPGWMNVAVTFCLVTFAWIFFRTENLKSSVLVCRRIANVFKDLYSLVQFRASSNGSLVEKIKVVFGIPADQNYGGFRGMILILFPLFVFCFASFSTRNADGLRKVEKLSFVFRWFLYISLCLLIVVLSVRGTSNFIYNQF